MKLKLYSLTAAATTVTVADEIFGTKVNKALISQAVHVYRNNQRRSHAKTLTRGEVALTGKKWFKQKGTGNARHGAQSANIFVGGGVSHGPTGMENWKRTMPVKMARRALVAALSAQAQAKVVAVVKDLDTLSGKAKDAAAFVAGVREGKEKLLVVVDASHKNVVQSLRNLERVSVTRADRLHTYETMLADRILVMQPALKVLEHRLVEQENA